MTQALAAAGRSLKSPLLPAALVALAVTFWAYWTTLGEAAHAWAHNPQYSHGYLVPAFALVLLWLRRGVYVSRNVNPTWWGMALLGGAVAMRLVGSYYHFVYLDPLSLLPALAGICVLLGGWACLRWAWPAVAFLFFMIPLPFSASIAMAEPLQLVATEASTFLLQTLGLPAVAEGNVILLNEVELGVVEACSGLRMLVVFFALSTAVAILIRKPLWEKLLICASAAPIALVVNILRITVTGVLHETAGSEIADAVFHDLAGWLMMPIALGLLALEMKLLKHLLIEPASGPTVAAVTPRVESYTLPRPTSPTPAPASAPVAAPALRGRRARHSREVARPFGKR